MLKYYSFSSLRCLKLNLDTSSIVIIIYIFCKV